MHTVLRTLNTHSEISVMVGDRGDTDIVAVESDLRTGVTSHARAGRFPYGPTWIYDSVMDIEV